ncbi:cob(I)yrinic acid a,c-diamide adenosyltransferase [Chloroflexota bacterium]
MTETESLQSFSSSEPFQNGLVQIFTGDGKGKTSAALGVVLRALSRELRVCIIVFMKGDYPYSEWEFLSKFPSVNIIRFGFRTFIDPANIKPEEIEQAKQALAVAREAVLSGKYDLVMLDEVNIAVAWKLLELDEVVRLVKDKPQNVELILTGRHADAKLIEMADLVTECLKIKHPYDRGIKARRGIDY